MNHHELIKLNKQELLIVLHTYFHVNQKKKNIVSVKKQIVQFSTHLYEINTLK